MGIDTLEKAKGLIAKYKKKIAKLESKNKDLERRLITDSLTGLRTRAYGQNALKKMVQDLNDGNLDSVAVLFMDIDHFKDVNDRYGHAVGDNVLQSVANMIKSHARTYDLVIRGRSTGKRIVRKNGPTRWGGEEMIDFLPNCSKEKALECAEKIRVAVEAIQFPKWSNLYVTLSIGVAVAKPSQKYLSVESLLEAADQAMYKAKEQGRNRVVLAE